MTEYTATRTTARYYEQVHYDNNGTASPCTEREHYNCFNIDAALHYERHEIVTGTIEELTQYMLNDYVTLEDERGILSTEPVLIDYMGAEYEQIIWTGIPDDLLTSHVIPAIKNRHQR